MDLFPKWRVIRPGHDALRKNAPEDLSPMWGLHALAARKVPLSLVLLLCRNFGLRYYRSVRTIGRGWDHPESIPKAK
jgi:hypothetical protein